MRWVLLMLAASAAVTTTAGAQAAKSAPPTPIDMEKAELGTKTWNPEWDLIIEKALPPEMLSTQVPRDVRRFCPRFFAMTEIEKRTFWAYFFQALAGAESGLDAGIRARRPDPLKAGSNGASRLAVRPEGLLQLTYADQKRYGCDFNVDLDRTLKAGDPARTILEPRNNLECGIKILYDQIIVRHKPLLTRSSYWSTLRPGLLSHRVFARQMINPPQACALPGKTTKIEKSETTRTVRQEADQTKSQP
jgi:hypothetical protein